MFCLLLTIICVVLFPFVQAVGEEDGGGVDGGSDSDGADSSEERVHGMVQEQISKSGTGISKASLRRYDTFISPKKKWMKVSFLSDVTVFFSYNTRMMCRTIDLYGRHQEIRGLCVKLAERR